MDEYVAMKDHHWQALVYVSKLLNNGPPLSQAILARVADYGGSFDLFVPPGVEAKAFETGGSGSVAHCQERIDAIISDFLNSECGLAVFEHFLIDANDPRAFLAGPVRIVDDTVYELAFAAPLLYSALPAIIKTWFSVPICVAALFDVGSEYVKQQEKVQESTALDIQYLLPFLSAIIVGAYDGEGFVVWRPRDR